MKDSRKNPRRKLGCAFLGGNKAEHGPVGQPGGEANPTMGCRNRGRARRSRSSLLLSTHCSVSGHPAFKPPVQKRHR